MSIANSPSGIGNGQTTRSRDLCGSDGGRHNRRGFRVPQRPVLGAVDREYRNRPGVPGVLFEIFEALVKPGSRQTLHHGELTEAIAAGSSRLLPTLAARAQFGDANFHVTGSRIFAHEFSFGFVYRFAPPGARNRPDPAGATQPLLNIPAR